MIDVQSSPDQRNLPVNRVGIRNLKHPIIFEDGNKRQPSVARFTMLVDLPKDLKGAHMSRFVEILNEQEVLLSVANLPRWLEAIRSRLEAKASYLQASFCYFAKKMAPVSQAISLMDYEVCLEGLLEKGVPQLFVTVIIPVTSLCPCSKEIADYGAHNQRSHVTVTAKVKSSFSLLDLIKLIESKASCELYGVLKRKDEKVVTERAYNNPKFVEDMVRDIAAALDALPTLVGYKISSENFESIHNHSAYAEIESNLNLSKKLKIKNDEQFVEKLVG